jgi:hypothetical protein
MNEILLKSGAVLVVNMAPFSASNKLLKVVMRELKTVDLELENLDLAKIATQDINTLKNAICQLLASDALEQSVFECMAKCTYNGSRVVKETFEPEDSRGDYLPCAWEVIKANLRPFFSGLDLSSLGSGQPPSDDRK